MVVRTRLRTFRVTWHAMERFAERVDPYCKHVFEECLERARLVSAKKLRLKCGGKLGITRQKRRKLGAGCRIFWDRASACVFVCNECENGEYVVITCWRSQ